MAASATDKFKKVANNFSSTTTSGIVGGSDTSVTLSSVTNLATDTAIDMVIDRVDATGNKTPAKREYVKGIVSGSQITNLVRGIGNSTAQAHIAGSVIEQVWDQNTWNDAVDGILVNHDQSGNHKSLTDTNGNSIVALSPISSAVNQVTVANAITGSGPTISATGTDANVNLNLTPKGTGIVNVSGGLTVAGIYNGWSSLGSIFTYAGNAGQKEFTVTATGDYTQSLTPGMKVSVARTGTPPTQAMAFTAASSQYASKGSPAGMTTNWTAFTCEAWIYVLSYPPSNSGAILNRSTGTTGGGWNFELTTLGQIRLFYGTGSTFTDFISYQSVPLNQWVHVAVVVSSTSSKTGAIYINGASVPSYSAIYAATALTQQSTSLNIGSNSTPIGFFNGYISETRLWSVAQSQASIQANMTISLTGSESNLLGLWQGNGNFNDKTSNANNLTAVNGAVATQASNPYNATEYAVVTKISYSSPNSTITLFTGNSSTIPNMAMGAVYYSAARAPYGFSADKTNWTIVAPFFSTTNNTISVPSSWTGFAGLQANLPLGSWKVSWKGDFTFQASASGTTSYIIQLYPSGSTPALDVTWQATQSFSWATGSAYTVGGHYAETNVLNTVQNTLQFFAYGTQFSGTAVQIVMERSPLFIRMECAYI